MTRTPGEPDADPSAETLVGEVALDPSPSEAPRPVAPSRAGELLGRGGMGEVRALRDGAIGRDIAVKLLRAERARDPEAVARFLREARVQGQLEHPAVVPVHQLGVDDHGEPYFTMKRLRGDTLAAVLERARAAGSSEPLERQRLLSAFVRVCQAIDFAHARGVIHRDLKPGNIMLGDFGEVYVLDWGLARLVTDVDAVAPAADVEPVSEPGDSSPNTAHGAIMGTVGYMPPEQLRGESVGPAADVYALGAILFEVLTLEPLHPRQDAIGTTLAGGEARASIRAPDAAVAPELEDVCVTATALVIARRPSARELAAAVERFVAGDRDLEARRALAADHAATAVSAAGGAEAADEIAMRRTAMREAGRALALDPDNQVAAAMIARLMVEPPQRTPPEVEAEIVDARWHTARAELRAGVAAFCAYLLMFPLLWWMGIREWWTIGGLFGITITLTVLLRWYAGRDRPQVAMVVATIPFTVALVFLISRISGPLLLAPMFAGLFPIAYLFHGDRWVWATATACLAAAIAIPLLLEVTGVIAPAYAFSGADLRVLARAVSLPETATLVTLAVVSIAFVVSPSIYLRGILARTREIERRMLVQSWHLRQLAGYSETSSSLERTESRSPVARDGGPKSRNR